MIVPSSFHDLSTSNFRTCAPVLTRPCAPLLAAPTWQRATKKRLSSHPNGRLRQAPAGPTSRPEPNKKHAFLQEKEKAGLYSMIPHRGSEPVLLLLLLLLPLLLLLLLMLSSPS